MRNFETTQYLENNKPGTCFKFTRDVGLRERRRPLDINQNKYLKAI